MTQKYKNKYRIKSARLPNWDYGSDGRYFITICTQNREHFFGGVGDKKMQLNEIGKIAEKYWFEIPVHFPFVKLGEFVVMPNHTHGIIIIDKTDDVIDGDVMDRRVGDTVDGDVVDDTVDGDVMDDAVGDVLDDVLDGDVVDDTVDGDVVDDTVDDTVDGCVVDDAVDIVGAINRASTISTPNPQPFKKL